MSLIRDGTAIPSSSQPGVFAELRRADAAVGAKEVLRVYGDQVLNLEVDDPGVLRDVDVVEDYRRLFGRDPW